MMMRVAVSEDEVSCSTPVKGQKTAHFPLPAASNCRATRNEIQLRARAKRDEPKGLEAQARKSRKTRRPAIKDLLQPPIASIHLAEIWQADFKTGGPRNVHCGFVDHTDVQCSQSGADRTLLLGRQLGASEIRVGEILEGALMANHHSTAIGTKLRQRHRRDVDGQNPNVQQGSEYRDGANRSSEPMGS